MCGRYTLTRLADVLDKFPWIRAPDSAPPPRYNVAPSQAVAVVPNLPDPQVDFYRWGLVPAWAKDAAVGYKMINARAETVADRPAFRAALKSRRCLVPADGFYEWRKDGKAKIPTYITMKTGEPFMFAGLWETWRTPDGSLMPSCTVLTTVANELMAPVHDRMPVILPDARCREWLAPGPMAPADAVAMLAPYPAEEMTARVVSALVNKPANDSPACIEGMTAGET